MDPRYKPDQPYYDTVTEGMVDSTGPPVRYIRKRLSGHDFKSAKPVAIKLNIGQAAGRALAYCGTNQQPVSKPTHE